MQYDFDEPVDRRSTNDLKWSKAAIEANLHAAIPDEFVPMWIADTDFACPPHIVEAIQKRAAKRIYGYCAPAAPFYRAVCWWQRRRHGWAVDPAWITALPSVVSGINVAIRTCSAEGDGVIIQPPVYDPFSDIVRRTGRKVVSNPLLQTGGRYEMDFALLERQAADPASKLLILCSPHNPVGRVWTEEELRRAAEICLSNGVVLVSDEIHSDIVYGDRVHRPVLALDDRFASRFVCLTSPGKTFNIPGLKTSAAIIPNAELKRRFEETQRALSLDVRNTFGLEGLAAAYSPESEPWLAEELAYLQGNIDFVEDFMRRKLPKITMVRPEGTFLCWLDCTELGLSDEALINKVNLGAGVVCVPGPWFGAGGEHHLRLNVGCPRATLRRAMELLDAALK